MTICESPARGSDAITFPKVTIRESTLETTALCEAFLRDFRHTASRRPRPSPAPAGRAGRARRNGRRARPWRSLHAFSLCSAKRELMSYHWDALHIGHTPRPAPGSARRPLLHSVLLWVGPKVFMPWVSQNPVSLPSLRVSHFGHMHSSEKEAGRNPGSCRTGSRALV